MDLSYYAFAIFVFLLLCALILVYTKATRQVKKNDASSEKEKRLFSLYQNLDEMMSSIESYVESARSEITLDKEKVAAMLKKAEQLYRQTGDASQAAKAPDPPAKAAAQGPAPAPHDERTSRHDRVAALRKQGLTSEQIAKELEISYGEVELILGVTKK